MNCISCWNRWMHNSACCGAETSIRLHPPAKACPQPGGRLCGQRCLPSLTVWLLARPHQLLAEGSAAQRAFHCPRDTERTSVCLSCTTTPHRCSQASLREDALTSDPSGGGDQTTVRPSHVVVAPEAQLMSRRLRSSPGWIQALFCGFLGL